MEVEKTQYDQRQTGTTSLYNYFYINSPAVKTTEKSLLVTVVQGFEP